MSSPHPPPPARPRAPSYTGLPPLHGARPKPAAPLRLHADDDDAPAAAIPFPDGAPSASTASLSSSSYAGSAADDAARAGADADALAQRLVGAFDPLQLDRSLALQAQTCVCPPRRRRCAVRGARC